MNPIDRHVAGATVQHDGPFSRLEVPIIYDLPSVDLRENWIRPLYFGLDKSHVADFIRANASSVTDELICELLSHFDWRSKVAGAYLAAIFRRSSFTEHIGRLLLRSDVSFAGAAYCLALAEFNSAEGLSFLQKYLNHYLSQVDLWFDQGAAMSAVAYLDEKNNTAILLQYTATWNLFIENKSNWSLQSSTDFFKENMQRLHALQAVAHDG
jgi:hypothetical protein